MLWTKAGIIWIQKRRAFWKGTRVFFKVNRDQLPRQSGFCSVLQIKIFGLKFFNFIVIVTGKSTFILMSMLVLAGTELIYFVVANMGQRFGFGLPTVLMI